MNHRFGMCVLIALWTLLVAPSTCVGGLLNHACAEDEAPACSHESDCPSDPCNVAHDVTTVAKPLLKSGTLSATVTPERVVAWVAGGLLRRPAAPAAAPPPLPAAALPLLC
jgi:hypothetical protein